MGFNTFGKIFCLTTFGESHGYAIGGVIDGFPAGFSVNIAGINKELLRQRPDGSDFFTKRIEKDEVDFISGLFEGKTTGAPLCFLIKNKDVRSKDYDKLKNIYRPSHADYTYDVKYGIRDSNGGGRSSARTLKPLIVAGAMAKQLLENFNLEIFAYVSQIGSIAVSKDYKFLDLGKIYDNPLRCPDNESSVKMNEYLKKLANDGDTCGGIITCVIRNVMPGLGEPAFNKLSSELAAAMFTINTVKGFDIGAGFSAADKKGSENNDAFVCEDGKICTRTNNSGGIQGGISNGEDIYFRVAMKPVSSIRKEQKTVDKDGNPVDFMVEGRHDICAVPRAVPLVESLAAMVILDNYLISKSLCLK
jgi:chorismate synthase